jgi:HCOMODA/2-hydroxy-3-carboxy-muconic semialdehyde decarboxylase
MNKSYPSYVIDAEDWASYCKAAAVANTAMVREMDSPKGDRVTSSLTIENDAILRDDLVAANRILVAQGVLDAYGHVSVRTAPGSETFLLSRSLAPASVTASDLLVHNANGEVSGDHRLYLERFIHSEIYRTRPDVMAVVHSHSPAVVPFSVVDVPIRAVMHVAGFLADRPTPVFEIRDHAGDGSDLLINSPALGDALAQTLGDGAVALMRGHGSVAVGASLPEAVYRAVYTELNARYQAQALALGTARYLTVREGAATAKSIGATIDRAWDVWREMS